ncbi:MAG: cytochrome P460 family protein [Nitrospirota bacterium]
MKTAVAALCLFALLAAGSGSYAVHEQIPSETQKVMPGPNAKALYDYITKTDPYTQWDMWPGKGKLYKGTEPHGVLLTTYVNEPALRSIGKKKGMANDAIIVKENYKSDKELAALTVMYKVKGYNPSAGNWFWAKYAPDGTVQASGKVESCIGCHAKNKAGDYILTK